MTTSIQAEQKRHADKLIDGFYKYQWREGTEERHADGNILKSIAHWGDVAGSQTNSIDKK